MLFRCHPSNALGLALTAVRQRMVDAGWSRNVINQGLSFFRGIFRWAAAEELLRFGREGIELDDVAARVEALEQAAPLPVKSPRWNGSR